MLRHWWSGQQPVGRALERNEARIQDWQQRRWPEIKKAQKEGQQQPAGLLQHGGEAIESHAARFAGADLIQRLIHFGHDVEAIEDMQGLGASFPDDLQIRLPHVRTDEGDLGGDFFADDGEEALKGFGRPFLTHPEQAGDAQIDLGKPASGTCDLWRTGFRRLRWRQSGRAPGAPDPR